MTWIWKKLIFNLKVRFNRPTMVVPSQFFMHIQLAYYSDKNIIKSACLEQMVHMKCKEWSLYLFKFIFCFQVTLYSWACKFSLKPYSDTIVDRFFIILSLTAKTELKIPRPVVLIVLECRLQCLRLEIFVSLKWRK